MATSIGKLSKSFFLKLLVGIIILPFVFWGMGDVFRGGNQNVIATVDSNKISTQEFVNYINRLNLSEEQRKNMSKTDLVEQILSDYIGKKVMSLEIEKLGIVVNDNALRDIIKNDKLFFKDNKFSRTEYEKFLISNSLSAPLFETNMAEQEKKRQLLSYLSGGIEIPNFLVQYEFNTENQTKKIEFINLKKFYDKPISEEKITEIFEKNKSFYTETFKDFKYAFKFMSDVAVVAEEINHHPTWTNTYNRLEIILTTHDTGGISKLDFELAKRIDVIFEKSK